MATNMMNSVPIPNADDALNKRADQPRSLTYDEKKAAEAAFAANHSIRLGQPRLRASMKAFRWRKVPGRSRLWWTRRLIPNVS